MLNLLAIALSLTAPDAAAQAATPPQSDEIVVEGARDRDRRIDAFVEALTDAPMTGQLSRFDWAVCPAAVGLTDVQAAAVEDRMRRVAQAAGIKIAPAGCKPNALVIATRSKRELIEGLRKQHAAYFTGMSSAQVNRLARSPGPAAAWQVEGRLNRDGLPLEYDSQGDYYVVQAADTHSRINPASRPHFLASVLVIEMGALKGLTVTQLADYAAMRTFARTDPANVPASAPTILKIIDAPMGSAIPVTLTQWDMGFLKALYTAAGNHYASQQRRDMQRQLRKELQQAPRQ